MPSGDPAAGRQEEPPGRTSPAAPHRSVPSESTPSDSDPSLFKFDSGGAESPEQVAATKTATNGTEEAAVPAEQDEAAGSEAVPLDGPPLSARARSRRVLCGAASATAADLGLDTPDPALTQERAACVVLLLRDVERHLAGVPSPLSPSPRHLMQRPARKRGLSVDGVDPLQKLEVLAGVSSSRQRRLSEDGRGFEFDPSEALVPESADSEANAAGTAERSWAPSSSSSSSSSSSAAAAGTPPAPPAAAGGGTKGGRGGGILAARSRASYLEAPDEVAPWHPDRASSFDRHAGVRDPRPRAPLPQMRAGSFLESMLSWRSPARGSQSVPGYCLVVRVLGRTCDFPVMERLPFDAVYYPQSPFGDEPACPYSAKVDMPSAIPLPPSGIVQLTLVNPEMSPLKMMMVRYNLTGMPVDTRTCQRYKEVAAGGESVVYVAHLSFLRVAVPPGTRRGHRGHALVGPIRLFFPSREPDEGAKLDIRYEHPAPDHRFCPVRVAPLRAFDVPRSFSDPSY